MRKGTRQNKKKEKTAVGSLLCTAFGMPASAWSGNGIFCTADSAGSADVKFRQKRQFFYRGN